MLPDSAHGYMLHFSPGLGCLLPTTDGVFGRLVPPIVSAEHESLRSRSALLPERDLLRNVRRPGVLPARHSLRRRRLFAGSAVWSDYLPTLDELLQ